jgi:hypothetical protein
MSDDATNDGNGTKGQAGERHKVVNDDRFRTLADIRIGAPRMAHNLAAVPLSGVPAASIAYRLIDEALAAKEAVVEEMSESGSVPELRLTNFSDRVILVVDGTELVGAKQNRIVNASFLIPPKSITRIPVSCVEQGRWGYKGKTFGESAHFAAHSIRKETVLHQKEAIRRGRGFSSDQGKVWSRVEELSRKMQACSPTSALNDVFEQKRASFDVFRSGIRFDGGEAGVAFFVNGMFNGIELFDRPDTLTKLFPKLLSGVAIEAMDLDGARLSQRRSKTPEEMVEYVKRIFGEVGRSFFEKFDPVGIGEDWRYDGKRSFGKALCHETDLVHLSVFAR